MIRNNAQPSELRQKPLNRGRVNDGWSVRRGHRWKSPRSWFEAKIDVRWSLDFMHDQLACGRFRIVKI